MPFEIPQQEPQVEVKVGPYQEYADAMLRGCAVTERGVCLTLGNKACALGAMWIGMGTTDYDAMIRRFKDRDFVAMHKAYQAAYGARIDNNNDSGRSREQIAARIAALR